MLLDWDLDQAYSSGMAPMGCCNSEMIVSWMNLDCHMTFDIKTFNILHWAMLNVEHLHWCNKAGG